MVPVADESVKKLSLNEIDKYILLLDNNVNGRDNREHKRVDTRIPLRFLIKSATGEMKEDINQPEAPSYFVDLSKGGAGILTGRNYKMNQEFYVRGSGDKRVFLAHLKVMNVRREEGMYRYGCAILKLDMQKS